MVYSPGASSIRSIAIQVAVSVVANLGALSNGMTFAFATVLLRPLLGSGPGLHTSLDQATWVASISSISASVGCVLAGPLIDRIGRRWGLLLLNLTFAAGWLHLAALPLCLPALYVGRILTGVGAGLASAAAATYTAEVSTVQLRTLLVTLTPLMMSVGVVLVYLWALLYQETWIEASYFGFGVSLLSLMLTLLLPESPLWLMSRGRAEEALQALMRLRGTLAPEQVKEEIGSFSDRAKETNSWLSILHNLRQPQAYKPLLIMNMFFFISNLTGTTIVIAYAVDFTQTVGIKTEAFYVALCMAGVRMLSTVFTSWLYNRYGKRGPTVTLSVIMTASLVLLTLNVSEILALSQWLAGALILVYVYSSSTSYSTILWSMLGEVYPTEVRGFASGITAGMGFAVCFVAVKLYPICAMAFGPTIVFLFFAISGVIGTFFLYFFLPETNGKTLTEIEDYFKGVYTRDPN